jgi:aspartate beta-hydroxylase
MNAAGGNELRADTARAIQFEQSGQTLQAELLFLGVLNAFPNDPDASAGVARLAMRRGDPARALTYLAPAVRAHPQLDALVVDFALAHLSAGGSAAAVSALESALTRTPSLLLGWLLLGQLKDASDDQAGANKAWYQAVSRARREGRWSTSQNMPTHLIDVIAKAKARVAESRRELFFGCYEDLREEYGAQELSRVDRALSCYLRESEATPKSARQRPTFLYFPGLPDTPYLDPFSQPWAEQLQAAFPVIREEALRVIEEDAVLPAFVDVPKGRRMLDYVTGEGPAPAWEAFFFYRHGERFDANHERCPKTSALLDSLDLCHINGQAPEILYSILRPGSRIMPHYGVSNVRAVMHLPLLVPADCALNIVDMGEHRWEEGQLVMFDDTYLHEAWNRSTGTRVILLMDCWNPHLSIVERAAVRSLIETISSLNSISRYSKD